VLQGALKGPFRLLEMVLDAQYRAQIAVCFSQPRFDLDCASAKLQGLPELMEAQQRRRAITVGPRAIRFDHKRPPIAGHRLFVSCEPLQHVTATDPGA
jgi:hypothetical protein